MIDLGWSSPAGLGILLFGCGVFIYGVSKFLSVQTVLRKQEKAQDKDKKEEENKKK